MSLCAYELERQQTIAANQKELARLGLDKPLVGKPTLVRRAPAKRPKQEDPDYKPEPKRTTRVSGRGLSKQAMKGDDDDDDDDEGDSSDSEDVPLRRPTKAPKRVSGPVQVPEPNPGSCVAVEAAKTGRSKCRKCMEMISEGEMRVGMESWMVGRQVMVWQHPQCFWSGVEVTVEPSGRGRCKQTKQPFAAGERRLSASAHTTTAHFKLAAGAALLRPVLVALGAPPNMDGVPGVDALESTDRQDIEETLRGDSRPKGSPPKVDPVVEATPSTTEALAVEEGSGEANRQPPKGRSTKTKGQVCWRFAGHLCYGQLLAAQETTTHCYARTHKGNTKTLTKGNASWWMLEN